MKYDNENNINVYREKLRDIGIKEKESWAVYGTGNGAKYLFAALREEGLTENIHYIIERDEVADFMDFYEGIPVVRLKDKIDVLNGILIAGLDHYMVIEERIRHSLSQQQLSKIRLVNFYIYNSDKDCREYAEYISSLIKKSSDEFVAFDSAPFERKDGDAKVIAWYLPQFHQMEINNQFHGQGFTEWTNTTQTLPVFTGHYQPHIPYDVGYYDLMNIDTLKRQIYLAKYYGVYGFCFHYYWFSGRKIMEKPIEIFLEHEELDMPFCINWANENWTALWDGGNSQIMLEQKNLKGDKQKFMDDILPYMKDRRYIKIDNKPVLIIYKADSKERDTLCDFISYFRERAKQDGFEDLYIMFTTSFDFDEDVETWGANAIVEYPPHLIVKDMEVCRPRGYMNPFYKGIIFNTESFINGKKYLNPHKSKNFFRSALTSWDNTARKATSNGAIFWGLSPHSFEMWLRDIMEESRHIHEDGENIVFVNSWNEWAEGSHLEPDMRYGYAYLQAVKRAIEQSRKK